MMPLVAEFTREQCDEVILLNDKGEVSEGTITNLFVEARDGRLMTPPLSSGCLAGVLRTSLLCQKKAQVSRILPADLVDRPFYLGNSLRGLIRGRLITDS
jgi:4-amino-4-deoxychorismate lyase